MKKPIEKKQGATRTDSSKSRRRQTPTAASVAAPIRQRFVRVQRRGVHYLRAGEGPPVILLHSAMSSAWGLVPLIERLASDHTVFAFDNPGMGDSDPLPDRDVDSGDAADALNATLVALKMPACPVYGSHTGGAIALELALRHPARVSALIMDGVTVFSDSEKKFFLSEEYLTPFPPIKNDGSHLLSSWVKARDHSMWFPWSKRTKENRAFRAFPPEAAVHGMFVEMLRAGAGYSPVYAAALKYDARKPVGALTAPATLMAQPGDPLLPHFDLLPKLKANQSIIRSPLSGAEYMDETARVLRSYQVKAKVPVDALLRPTPGAINRRYADLPDGQILVRSAGEAVKGRPLLMLHDGRASSRMFEPLMRILARSRPVYAPDMPDNGASFAFRSQRTDIPAYADAVAQTVVALGIESCDLYAVGAGAAVALDLASRPAFTKAHILLETPDFYSPALARRLAGKWAPPMSPEWDGTHLSRLWLMLRDEYAFWPWFDKSAAAACAVDAPSDWSEVHARVSEILRSLPTYHRLTEAALRYDWRKGLGKPGRKAITLASTANDPRQPHVETATRQAGWPEMLVLPTATKGKAQEILQLGLGLGKKSNIR